MLAASRQAAGTGPLVFLFDVDNTLLDNDRFAGDLAARLEQDFGAAGRERYWKLYGERRDQLGYADYLGTLQLFREGLEDQPELLRLSAFLLDYPFARNLYPEALEVIRRLGQLGQPVVLSDGDVVFQPHKLRRSGIWDAVAGRVMIEVHKQLALEAMQRRYPAQHYVMTDDKPQILAAMKQLMGAKLSTVFVRQGHYAAASAGTPVQPAPDFSIAHIGELPDLITLHFQAAGLPPVCGVPSRSTS